MRTMLLVGLVSLAAAGAATARQDPADVEITTVPVADGVYMLLGSGGNIGLSVGSDGPFLVDDQFAPLTEKIRAAVAAVSSGNIRFLVNTHWHGDHTGGNENFGEAGTLIVAHENVRTMMSTEQFMEAFNQRVPASPQAALPVITFTQAMTFHWNGHDIQVYHVPHAHTDGDAIVRFQGADAVHMGDAFMNGFYPFIDVSSGGSLHGVINAAETVLAFAGTETRIIPGHGPLASTADLRRYRSMLVTVRDRIQAMKNDGADDAAIVASNLTSDLDAEWGDGFLTPEQFVQFVLAGWDNWDPPND